MASAEIIEDGEGGVIDKLHRPIMRIVGTNWTTES
jgi:hypothetical protein